MKIWQVDSFTDQVFKGNPAGVCILDKPLEDSLMQNIAAEMNLSETAFILPREGQNPLLRWFMPDDEIDLCGHATLAAAHIWMTAIEPDMPEIIFDTKVAGTLAVAKSGNSQYTMNFPVRAGDLVALNGVPEMVINALSSEKPIAALQARDLMLVYENEEMIRSMTPDIKALEQHDGYIIVTAPSSGPYDFISRFFCASDGIAEDPVTGSAHCTLAPYWAERFGKADLKAYQASERGGVLDLSMKGDRLDITGNAVTVLRGELLI